MKQISKNNKAYLPFVDKLTLKEASKILAVSPITVTRISKDDPLFPVIFRAGRSNYISCKDLYCWLSLKVGFEVLSGDKSLTSKDLQILFGRSHTWIWSAVKMGVLPQPYKVNRSTFWMKSQIDELINKDNKNAFQDEKREESNEKQ